eukprot:52437-Chlamydomonas_euryale.AAC.2
MRGQAGAPRAARHTPRRYPARPPYTHSNCHTTRLFLHLLECRRRVARRQPRQHVLNLLARLGGCGAGLRAVGGRRGGVGVGGGCGGRGARSKPRPGGKRVFKGTWREAGSKPAYTRTFWVQHLTWEARLHGKGVCTSSDGKGKLT